MWILKKFVPKNSTFILVSQLIVRVINHSFFFAAFHAVSCHFSPLNADPTIAYELFECI